MKGKAFGVRTCTALLAWGAALCVAASTARAADPAVAGAQPAAPLADGTGEITARERSATRFFYGWKILATGEAGGVLAAAATVIPDSPLKTPASTVGFLIGMPFYALGGPATHWSHGDFAKGLVSLGANFAGPLLGGFIGNGVACAPSDRPANCGTQGFFTGFAIALVTVPVVDAFVLGWESIPDDDPVLRVDARMAEDAAARSRRRLREARAASLTMIPAWSLGPRGELAFGVTGRF
jgi:hypothetical protein